MDDAELVERARSGDDEALDEIVRRHHGAAFRLAHRIVGDDDRAADVAQEAFIKAFRALDGFRGEASLRTWLMTIVANEARGALRTIGRRRQVALEELEPVFAVGGDVARDVVVRTEVERVRSHIAMLPEKQRLAVTLRLDEGMSFRDVGDVIGSSEGAARVNYYHGVRRLRELMEES